MENKIWKPIPDGTYIRDSIIDGRITLKIQEEGSLITIIGPEEMWESINLEPFPYRLCYSVKPIGLDFPDGPGWWAFEGHFDYGDTRADTDENRVVLEVILGASDALWACVPNGSTYRVKSFIGKWYRLHMP